MFDVTPVGTTAPQNGAYKVGNFDKGEMRSDLSRQWMARPADERFLSLDELKAHVRSRRERSREDVIDSDALTFFNDEIDADDAASSERLWVGLPDGSERTLTHLTFGQIAGLAQAPAAYLRKLPAQIVAPALSYGLRYNRNGAVKSYATPDELMAVTGPDYGRIYDEEVVSAVQMIAGNGTGDERWKVPGTMVFGSGIYDPNAPVTPETTTLYASDRDVFMFLVDDRNPIEVGKLPDRSPDLMFRGFYIQNSEMGTAALKLATFYLRAVCCNRLMWGVERFEEIRMRHSKYAPARFLSEARPALRSFTNASDTKLIEGVKAAKATKVADDKEKALDFLAKFNFTRKRSEAVLTAVEKEEGHPARTVWDMAQGITAVARDEPNNDTRVELELTARKILDKVA